MLEPRFCYLVLEETKMAHDGEEKGAPFYSQMNFEGGNLLTEENYNFLHERLKFSLSVQLHIPVKYIKCVSQEEFDKNHNEESL